MLSGAPEVGGAGAQHVFEEGRPLWLEQHAGAVAGSHGEGTAGPQGALGASAVPVNKGETSDGSFVGTGEGQWGQLHALKSPPPQAERGTGWAWGRRRRGRGQAGATGCLQRQPITWGDEKVWAPRRLQKKPGGRIC